MASRSLYCFYSAQPSLPAKRRSPPADEGGGCPRGIGTSTLHFGILRTGFFSAIPKLDGTIKDPGPAGGLVLMSTALGRPRCLDSKKTGRLWYPVHKESEIDDFLIKWYLNLHRTGNPSARQHGNERAGVLCLLLSSIFTV